MKIALDQKFKTSNAFLKLQRAGIKSGKVGYLMNVQ